MKFQGTISDATMVYLPSERPLNSYQLEQFWQIVAGCKAGNVAEHNLPDVVSNTWNSYHFATMGTKNPTGFGGCLTKGHARKLLQQKGHEIRMTQIDQLMKHQARTLFPPPHVQSYSTPSLVAKKAKQAPPQPKELTKEILNNLSFRDMKHWLRKYHLPLTNQKQTRFNTLKSYLEKNNKWN